jgi:hypothetical protein
LLLAWAVYWRPYSYYALFIHSLFLVLLLLLLPYTSIVIIIILIMEGTYNETLTWCVAALVLKNMVNHLLVVRCRLATRQMGQSVAPEGDPSQWQLPVVFPLLYYAMGSFAGPWRSEADLARFQVMEVNASQNETYFMILAMVWPNVGGGGGAGMMPDWAPMALLIFTYARMAHFVIFTVVKVQPWRAFAYTAGVLVTIAMSVNILQGSK